MSEEVAAMEQFDGSHNHGRKGIAYDWQSLLAAAEAESIDAAIVTLTSLEPAA